MSSLHRRPFKAAIFAFLSVTTFTGYAQDALTPVAIVPDTTGAVEIQKVEIIGRKQKGYRPDYTFGATKTEMKLKDVPQSVSVVTKEVISDLKAQRLKDALQVVSGVSFSSYDYISIRGFDTETGRLYNGLRLPTNLIQTPLFNVERIEVIKGPASALFSDAVPGGTVNYVTKKPLPEESKSVSVSVGSWNDTRASIDFTGPLNKDKTLLYRLNVGHQSAESFRDNYSVQNIFVAPTVSYLPDDKTRINAEVVIDRTSTGLDRGQLSPQNATAPGRDRSRSASQPGDYLNYNSTIYMLSASRELNYGLTMNAAYMNARLDKHLREHGAWDFVGGDTLRLNYMERLDRAAVNNLTAYLTWEGETGPFKHTALAGADYIHHAPFSSYLAADSVGLFILSAPENRIRSTDGYALGGGNYGDLQYSVYGVYGQLLTEWNRLKLLLSLRREFFIQETDDGSGGRPEKKIQAWIPRVGITYGITEDVSVYASWNNGFQPAPTWVQDTLYGGPFEDPEISNQYEAGVKAELLDKRLMATAAVYQITKQNAIVWANEPSNSYLYRQRGEERSRGVEFELAGRVLPSLNVSAAYSYCDAIILDDPDPAREGKQKEFAPKHTAGFLTRYRSPIGAGVLAGARYVGDRATYSASYRAPSYTTVNAGVFYEVGKAVLSLNAYNLADERYYTFGDPSQGMHPGTPRSYMASLDYRF